MFHFLKSFVPRVLPTFCSFSKMDRQISYNGPLTPSPLPCNFPGSRSPTLMKHPLPPKPPISMYFHAYTPLSPQPKTALRDVAAQYVERGKSIPVNNGQNRPFANHHATASSNGVSSSPHADSVIRPSGEGSSRSTTYCCLRLILY